MIVGDKRDSVEVIDLVLAYAATDDASPPPQILSAGNVSGRGGGGGNSNGSSSEHLNTTTGSSSPESSGSSGGVSLGEKLGSVTDVGGEHEPTGQGSNILRATLALVVEPAPSEPGNKCGKCQNHEIEISKKGHARDCPFKKCNCLKCRLLDARSDILQVISGKETKLKGTKKDPNCGFCQNHNIKILRKGHVRSCGFGQERHFRLDNCFDCEVHYIRNEVNRLQIKMRRAMKEDRTLTEEQRKTAREAITRDEVEKVCNLARLARKKRENILTQQAVSGQEQQQSSNSLLAAPSGGQRPVSQQAQQAKQQQQQASTSAYHHHHHHHHHQLSEGPHKHNYHHQDHLLSNQQHGFVQTPLARQVTSGDVWRPWSQHHQRQVALAQQQQQQQHQHHQQVMNLVSPHSSAESQAVQLDPNASGLHPRRQQQQHQQHQQQQQQQQQQQYLGNNAGHRYQHGPELVHLHEPEEVGEEEEEEEEEEADRDVDSTNMSRSSSSNNDNIDVVQQLSPPSTPPATLIRRSTVPTLISSTSFANPLVLPNAATLNLATACDHQQHHQNNSGGLALTEQRNLQEQQLFNTLFRLIVAQFAQSTAANVGGH